MLPFNYWLWRMSGTCEPELLHLSEFCGSTGTAIDIGASIGLFTYPLSKLFQRVYAFEINDEITQWIGRYNPGNIELIHCGLSSAAGTARFYIPVAHGMRLVGWGSLNRDNLPGTKEFLERDVKVAPLDDFGITGIGFIKIDVEGHELEVLKGAAATIAQSRPIVLVELKSTHIESADSWFLGLDYRRFRLEDLLKVQGHPANYIYVPVEQLVQFGIDKKLRP